MFSYFTFKTLNVFQLETYNIFRQGFLNWGTIVLYHILILDIFGSIIQSANINNISYDNDRNYNGGEAFGYSKDNTCIYAKYIKYLCS